MEAITEIKFIKSRRTNKVSKIVREVYLRDDIPCGVVQCDKCQQKSPILSGNVLILSAKVIEQQIDALEQDVLKNLVVPLSQLELVSNVIQKRITNIVNQPQRQSIIYPDKFNKSLHINRLSTESKSHFQERQLKTLFDYFKSHVCAIAFDAKVYLISDIQSNGSISLYHYAELNELESLMDFISTSIVVDKDFQHVSHCSEQDLDQLLQENKAFIGKLDVSHYNCFQGSISIENDNLVDKLIMVMGNIDMNRAIHGDTVAVEIYGFYDPMEDALNDNNDTTTTLSKQTSKSTIPKGRIISIIKRNPKHHVCSIDVSKLSPNQLQSKSIVVPCLPMDKKIPRIYIRTTQLQRLRGKRLVIKIDEWNIQSKFPMGHYVQTIGSIDDKVSETQAILFDHDISNEPFTQQVLDEMPSENWTPTIEDYTNRACWGCTSPSSKSLSFGDSEALVCSIDPPGCTDIDDTLHCKLISDTTVQIGVHIADVSHFIKHNSFADKEANLRGTTVYLVDQRIDMFPSVLGSNVCSLKSDVLRLAFSVIFEIDISTGQIIKTTYCKSIVKSVKSFTYDQAQAVLDNKPSTPLDHSLHLLNKIAKIKRKERLARGPLTLASPEVKFRMETDSQDVLDIEFKELKEANQLVEEYMLMANIAVAERCYEYFPSFALLRCHPKPPMDNFKQVCQSLEASSIRH